MPLISALMIMLCLQPVLKWDYSNFNSVLKGRCCIVYLSCPRGKRNLLVPHSAMLKLNTQSLTTIWNSKEISTIDSMHVKRVGYSFGVKVEGYRFFHTMPSQHMPLLVCWVACSVVYPWVFNGPLFDHTSLSPKASLVKGEELLQLTKA